MKRNRIRNGIGTAMILGVIIGYGCNRLTDSDSIGEAQRRPGTIPTGFFFGTT